MVHPLVNIMRSSPSEIVRAGYAGAAKLYAMLYCDKEHLPSTAGETSDINACL
jgi:hypothetical protein